MKKIFLGLGSICVCVSVVVTAVSCGGVQTKHQNGTSESASRLPRGWNVLYTYYSGFSTRQAREYVSANDPELIRLAWSYGGLRDLIESIQGGNTLPLKIPIEGRHIGDNGMMGQIIEVDSVY